MDNHHWIRKRLLEKYSADTQGVWEIRGEDPNCDLGGAHGNPKLEVVKGTYRNVVEYALHLRSFFTWGSGGEIIKLENPNDLKDVDKLYSAEVLRLKEEKAELEKKIAAIDTKIKNSTK